MTTKKSKLELLAELIAEPTVDCLPWPYDSAQRYPRIAMNGRLVRVHRAAWVLRHGEIAEGLEVGRTCLTERCVNPIHLDLTQRGGHVKLAAQREGSGPRDQCERGHALNGANLYVSPKGARQCRACNRLRRRERRNQEGHNLVPSARLQTLEEKLAVLEMGVPLPAVNEALGRLRTLERKISALEAVNATLEARVKALEKRPSGTEAVGVPAALEKKVEALESKLKAIAAVVF